MRRISIESATYQDVEKFYRVLGYYEGQTLKPLDVHEKFIQKNLDENLRDRSRYIRRLEFELFMNRVVCDKEEVFEAEKVEATLVYALFVEGIKSLILLRDLTAYEIRDWCDMVRQTLIAFDRGDDRDLASVLWKAPYRNIRARIHHNLMNLVVDPDAEVEELSEDDWHNRDHEWSLPEASNIRRNEGASKPVNPEALKEIRSNLQSIQVNRAVHQSLFLDQHEINRLSEELSFYDQNQTEFNLLNFDLDAADSDFGADNSSDLFVAEQLVYLTKSIINRFHPGMIVFLLEEMEKISHQKLEKLLATLRKTIGDSLQDKGNEKKLLDSLADPERQGTTKKLLPYVNPEQFSRIIEFYIEQEDTPGLCRFLEVITRRDLPLIEIFLDWDPELLVQILPYFRNLKWKDKEEFLMKLLRTKNEEVLKQASYFVAGLPLPSGHAADLYRKLPNDIKEIWMRAFHEASPQENWRGFIKLVLEKGYWCDLEKSPRALEIMQSWVEIFFKYFGPSCFPLFERWVKGRKLMFWPRYTIEREAILNAGLVLRNPQLKQAFLKWAKGEERVPFQEKALKDRLKGAL